MRLPEVLFTPNKISIKFCQCVVGNYLLNPNCPRCHGWGMSGFESPFFDVDFLTKPPPVAFCVFTWLILNLPRLQAGAEYLAMVWDVCSLCRSVIKTEKGQRKKVVCDVRPSHLVLRCDLPSHLGQNADARDCTKITFRRTPTLMGHCVCP